MLREERLIWQKLSAAQNNLSGDKMKNHEGLANKRQELKDQGESLEGQLKSKIEGM